MRAGPEMKLVSVNVGLPREVKWDGRLIRTSIFKAPVAGRVQVRTINLDGDQQSDLTVHGGVDKAVYVYPSEHYAFWRDALPDIDLSWGAFGENFTTQGPLDDKAVHIGDRFRIGSTEFIVTQPRIPCFKLGIRFGRTDMVKQFLHSGRNGFYFAVVKEGDVAAGDSVELLARDENGITVADIVQLYTAHAAKPDFLQRVSELAALPENWRAYFRKRLFKPDA
jgi:MOSC domain-containing protein YiiM